MTRFPLTTIAACAAIFAVTHALPIRANAEESRPDCIAMLDLITTCADQQALTAARPLEFPAFLPDALDVRAMTAPETTGVSNMPPAERKEAAASRQESKTGADMSDDKYNR
jgi:hypothetical protein